MILGPGNEAVACRRRLRGNRWTPVVGAVVCGGLASMAVAMAPLETVVVRARQFDVEYRPGSSSTPLTAVELWYTLDHGETWHLDGLDPDRVSPVRFLAPAEGLYGFHLVLRNRYGASSPPPTTGTEPQRWVLVDFTSPVLQFQSARPDEADGGERRVQLRWSAYDANLLPRPVRVEYRRQAEANWTPIVAHLTNRGRFDWEVPDAVSGNVWFRLTVQDRAGHVVGQERGPVVIGPPRSAGRAGEGGQAGPTTSRPSGSREVPTTQAARPVVSEAAAAEAIARFELGTFHRLRGELGVAAERFREALRLDPAHLAAGNDLAGVLYLTGAYDQSIQAYADVLKQAPTHRSALKGLALAYMAQRDYRNAHERLAELLKLDPDKGETWLHLGDVAMLSGNTLDASSYWSKALAVEPNARAIIEKASTRLAALRSFNEGFALAGTASQPPVVGE